MFMYNSHACQLRDECNVQRIVGYKMYTVLKSIQLSIHWLFLDSGHHLS